jgi:hypothetical protein
VATETPRIADARSGEIPKHSISCSRKHLTTPFVRDFPESLKAKDVKTNLSCETSFKVCKLKM